MIAVSHKHLLVIIVISFICLIVEPAKSVTITFEEPISLPTTVVNQYSMNPNNFGVNFFIPCQIFEPKIIGSLDPTSSPPNALTNEPLAGTSSTEFAANDKILIGFTTGQSYVSVQAGLTKSHPNGVNAHLRAYSSDNPGDSAMIGWADVYLGTGPNKIAYELKVTSPNNNIKSVEIWFSDAAGKHYFEVIDDLAFSNKGPPSITDTAPPVVEIIKPVEGQTFHNPYYAEMEYTVKDSESGVGRIEIVYLDENGKIIQSYDSCGGKWPPCPGSPSFPPKETHSDYYTTLPNGAKKIKVNAWDYAGHMGQAEENIKLIPVTGNLWAQGMEITQGTQPTVFVNENSRSTGTPIPFDYSKSSFYLPLVAKRRTVVRLYPGLEGTTGNLPLDKVRAKLSCFIDSSYKKPFPGKQIIEAENRLDRNILKEITVEPGATMDSMQRDVSQSWNFMLPEEWTEAGRTIYLEAYVQAPNGIDEPAGYDDSSNKIRISGIQFLPMPDANDLIYFVSCNRIDMTTGSTFSPTQQEISKALNYFGRRIPIDEDTLPNTVYSWTWKDYASDCDDALNKLQKATAPDVGQRKGVYSIGDSTWPCSGKSNYFYAVGVSWRLDAVAHEIGHDLKLLHAGPPPGHGSPHVPLHKEETVPNASVGAIKFGHGLTGR